MEGGNGKSGEQEKGGEDMVRMRYPQQALELLKKEDPDTQVTLHFIRSLVAKGAIPYVQIGRRRLINYDKLVEYLANPPETQVSTEEKKWRI